jgi:hypothetical protein
MVHPGPCRLGAIVGALLACAHLWGQPYGGPIFDAHLHYNVEARSEYPTEVVLEKLLDNGVRAVVSNSRPNDGTRDLAAVVAARRRPDIRIVPFVRLYRDRADYESWHRDPAIYDLTVRELASGTAAGPYLGIGEFHLYGAADARNPTAARLTRLASERGLVLLAHCDDAAIDILMSHAPGVTILWAHTGISGVPIERVEALMRRYSSLRGELSYRPGLTGADGLLEPEWRALILAMPERFLVGSDTWVNARWAGYGSIIDGYRVWLGALPAEIARKVAWENGLALFGPSRVSGVIAPPG